VVDALAASMAIPTLFSSTFVGPEYTAVELSGGHLMFNNPARELLKEAQRVYGDKRRLSLILSLGSGKPKDVSLGGSNQESSAMEQLLKKLVVNSEATERDLAHQLYEVGAYVRLNGTHGTEDIQLHEWSQLSIIVAHTQDYLTTASITKLVDHSVLGLLEKQGIMSFNQLSESISGLLYVPLSYYNCSQARSTRIRRQAKAPPAVSPYFVVRKEGWDIMQEKLLGPRLEGLNVFVISGMGGCGKTQMVSYFVQKYQDK
jgi:hypothetical protein